MSDSTYVLNLEEVDSRKNETSLGSDGRNIETENQVSVESSSLRSPVDSMFGDDSHHLLGGHHSTVPVIMSPTWNGRARNLSSKSSSTTRRYSFQYCRFVAIYRVLAHTYTRKPEAKK